MHLPARRATVFRLGTFTYRNSKYVVGDIQQWMICSRVPIAFSPSQHCRLLGCGEFRFKLALAMQLEMNGESVVLELACEWDAAFWRAGHFYFGQRFLHMRVLDCQHIHQAARAGAIWSVNFHHWAMATRGPMELGQATG
jgi:hypothetical protein